MEVEGVFNEGGTLCKLWVSKVVSQGIPRVVLQIRIFSNHPMFLHLA